MKTKLGASLLAALMMMGLFGAASATADPGPNGSNEKGLCTAYFNGQKKGHDKDGDGRTDNARAFQGLEAAGEAYDAANGGNDEDLPDEQQLSDDVFEFCDQFGIMGQPEQNGRFDCREGEDRDSPVRDSDDDQEVECVPNGTEG
jgi:hypothetical protein